MTSKKNPPKSAADDAEQLEIQAGRRAPFTMAPDWILLAPVTRDAKILYWALAAHISQSRDDSDVWPTQDQLATLLGYTASKVIRERIKELLEIGAIEKRTIRTHGGMRQRTIYTVHQTPPEQWDSPESLKGFYRSLKEESSQVTPEEACGPVPERAHRPGREEAHGPAREEAHGPEEPDELELDEHEQHHGAAAAAVVGGGELSSEEEGEESETAGQVEGSDVTPQAEQAPQHEQHARALLRSLRLPRGQRFNIHAEAARQVTRAVQAGVPDGAITEFLLEGSEDAHTPGAIVTMRCRQIDDLIATHEENKRRQAEHSDQEDTDTGHEDGPTGPPEWCGDCDARDRTRFNEEDRLVRCPRCNSRSKAFRETRGATSVTEQAQAAAVALGMPA